MNRHPSLRPSQVVLVILVSGAIIVGSFVRTAWATPMQDPHRQSVPTDTPTKPTPTSTPIPTSTPSPTPGYSPPSTPEQTATPTTTPASTPYLPKTGEGAFQEQKESVQAGVILGSSTLVLLGGGLAALVAVLRQRVRRR